MSMICRRRFLRLSGAAGAASIIRPGFAHAHPDGYTSALPAVVDASQNLTRAIPTLKGRGVKAVIRYYALANNLPEKIVTKEEASTILNAGLSLAISYQYNNGNIQSFTAARANKDAAKCVSLADEIGQPSGSAIYFGVDKDWVADDETEAIAAYFETLNAHEAFNKRGLRVGVYGSGFTCEWIRRRKLAEFFWIAGLSDAWTGRSQFMKSQNWNLYQNALEVAAEPDRADTKRIDTNIINPKAESIGSFSRSPAGKIIVDGAIDNADALKVHRVAKSAANVFEQAGEGGELIRTLPASKIVSVVSEHGEYVRIDVPRQIRQDGKMIADFQRGDCRTAALSRVEDYAN